MWTTRTCWSCSISRSRPRGRSTSFSRRCENHLTRERIPRTWSLRLGPDVSPQEGKALMAPPTRWATEPPENHSQWLIDRFRRLAAEGADLGGEARLVDAVIVPGASVLDAGCGTGRVGALLHAAGHPVVGVDADELLIAAARSEHPSIE